MVIYLPRTPALGIAPRQKEKEVVYPDVASHNWISITRQYAEDMYPHMPVRIIDNLLNPQQTPISVVPWDRIARDPDKILRYLIDIAF